ncbi:hypothetical protein QBC35DRAFT_252948 [Podospora australis]|uniref:Zn(2)-C6 fungal-type domain-containing protein n=1 Tax=Podospora australis TaxID=1536484 RepID=A0AAN7AHL2_9PEZI|nr:hypothetical protein QBC35DRAFT_252948 [Podospora australis]
MVGVPGKFKGCNTCRVRRVKCDNERPFCRKCIDSGRECAGYERETVFIIGTIEDQGRCSSHPPRVVKSKRNKPSSSKPAEDSGQFTVTPRSPLRPAWDDWIAVTAGGKNYRVQLAGLHTGLDAVSKVSAGEGSSDDGNWPVYVSFPAYETPDVRPYPGGGDFQLSSQCLVHLATPDDGQGGSATDSVCVFLFEHNNSVMYANQAWNDPAAQNNFIRQMGPSGFRSFPNHHFFVRVYRPSAICTALLNSTPIYLASPEWINTPWEQHPKSSFDRLLDIIVLLPTLFARADQILTEEQTTARRLMAQDLLNSCLDLEIQLSHWCASVIPSSSRARPTYWVVDPSALVTPPQMPFTEVFAFADLQTSLALIYYWTALVLFYPRIWRLYWAIFEPVVDGTYPQTVPVLPPRLQIDPMRYSAKEIRELAANICRSFDYALSGSAQPDLLVTPLHVAQSFYGDLSTGMGGWDQGGGSGSMMMGDGRLELIWCEGFHARLVSRGRDIQEVVQGRAWMDYGGF